VGTRKEGMQSACAGEGQLRKGHWSHHLQGAQDKPVVRIRHLRDTAVRQIQMRGQLAEGHEGVYISQPGRPATTCLEGSIHRVKVLMANMAKVLTHWSLQHQEPLWPLACPYPL
jgi:hypothetical protein